ncbi:hypothetical protein TwortDSMZ_165 [Staphylococcus phage Twort]|uniref:Uncharacterized protein n=2 Tax=Staphylococcus phage Twort (strain DSM 17442 / HER 48) TaxID=2908167 RepID=A0A6H0X5I5_BPTWO|nr:ORF093 [Staphylococcus phage Twort]AAX92387.1 ORF093 [Staphylococcus phage Twort]QIW89163.1 hypothetical protein TwortDSMZ_165 [Staphylococcus phage Twort]
MKKKDKPKRIWHQPVNFAPTNNLAGANPTFFPKKGQQPKESKGYEYRIQFIKRFDNVTNTDVSMQKKYMLNLISRDLNLPEKYITLTQKGKKKEDILHTNRIYYVYRSKKLIGKCAIQEQRTFTTTNLLFIFKLRKRKR